MFKIKTIIALMCLSTFSQAANVVETKSERKIGYLGLLAGGNGTPAMKVSANPTIGLTLGAKLTPFFGIGALGSVSEKNNTGSIFGLPVGTTTRAYVFAGQANYFLGGLHLGGEVGAAVSTWSANVSTLQSSDRTSTAMIFGPEGGYDFQLGESASIGAEAHYLFKTVESGMDNIQVFAALKLWQ